MDVPDDAGHRERLQRALGADYELGELLGRGGFGAVYRARDVKLERDVAVKALRHDVFPTPTLLERFQREARAVARLRHPNILSVHTVGEAEGIAFMVMPLVEGESLEDLLERDGRVPVDETVRIVGDVAAALEAAHKKGLVHRDVKPANIMLDGEERRVLLMDFGIAKAVTGEETSVTGTGVVIGSPVYMSPEQAAGEKDIDGRSDIYSLGAVAYEMLTGRLPFPADSLHELVYKQVTQEVPELAERAPDVPDPVADAVMRCLESDREDRWQTAADFRSAIVASEDRRTPVPSGHAAEEEQSWLSWRGPYVLLLAVLFLAFRAYMGWMRDVMTETVYVHWTGRTTLEFTVAAVAVLLFAAALDLLVRVSVRVYRGLSWLQIARYVLGQPDWWQTWYPRPLRVRDSVWDRLPSSMKLLRTLVWLELIVMPASWLLVLFVMPTFQAMFASAGREAPLLVTAVVEAYRWALYLLPLTLALMIWKFREWKTEHGVPPSALIASLFSLKGSYWQGSSARAILRD